MTTFEKVVNILVDAKDCEADKIKMESTWVELELDSLDTVELVMNLEDEFSISLEMNENLKTVGDVVKAIDAALE
ncbi:acyl carrier protein [Sinanaerobacter sp. ZZT-01]|uniref:acyl carrier protein n=1 Tax=Sinanaerobacter sp. ZZT-01 TaxID=3111540 RepID=UPI002D7A3AAC|nr:acyl carrier protein [Sinanaerobacter sp. ZZT-01]WRR92094.1 acyl carrier protein [Sinanaerobacter sp. ZZT-01]